MKEVEEVSYQIFDKFKRQTHCGGGATATESEISLG